MAISIAAEIARAKAKKKDVAELLGIDPAALSRKLANDNFSISEVEKILSFLGYALEIKEKNLA